MKEPELPVVPIDATSNQMKFATQAQAKEDASDVAAARLHDIADIIRAEVEANSVKAMLDPTDNSLAALSGRLMFSFDPAGLTRLSQVFESFRSLQETKATTQSEEVGQYAELPSVGGGFSPVLSLWICRSNPLGQANCHGENVDRSRALAGFAGVDVVFELLSGQEPLGKATARLGLGCVIPGSIISNMAGYLEAPYRSQSYADGFWAFERRDMSLYANLKGHSLWDAAKRDLKAVPIAVLITAQPVPDYSTAAPIRPPPSPRAGGVPVGPHGVCLQRSSNDDLRLILPMQPGPIMRNFYLVGPREIIEQVDGMRVSGAPHQATQQDK
jgi:hypothetical protein